MNKVILKFVTVCVLTANTVTALGAETVSFRDERFSTGDVYAGFEVTALRSFDYLKSDVIFLEHEKTGAEVICIDNNDTNKTFELAFKTPLEDEKGLTHVLEHAVLSGSEKYPSSTLKNKLMLQTYNTLMNGESFKYTTAYPIASASEDQLYALAEFYMDSAFNPMFPSDASVFDREAWHYELDDAESQISITGTCYNENKGLDTISNAAYDNLMKALYPDSYSGNSKYGVNKEFLAMTNDDLIDYHSKYYHPSNSLTVLYGDMDFERFLGLLDTYFSEYDKTELAIDISAHSPTESYIEEQFEYPASADDESGVYSIFAVECPGVNAKELTALEMAADIFNTDGSAVRQRLKETLPEANVTFEVSYYDSPEPLFIAVSSDLAENDAKVMAETVTDALKDGGSISDSLKNAAAASSRREKAVSFESASVGADLAYDITQSWAVGDAQLCFDMLDSDENTIADSIEETVSKYFAEPSRSALVTTVPVPGAAEKEQADLNADLTALKDSMSAEEIQALVDKTAQYKNNTQQTNDEIDNEFIEELSVVDINELPETVRDYNIQDTTVHGVRYVTSIADIEDIGKDE